MAAQKGGEQIVMNQPVATGKPGDQPPAYQHGGEAPSGAQVMGNPPTGIGMSGVPVGLEYLAAIDKVDIHQVLHIEEGDLPITDTPFSHIMS